MKSKRVRTMLLTAAMLAAAAAPASAVKTAEVTKLDIPAYSGYVYAGSGRIVYLDGDSNWESMVIMDYHGNEIAAIPGDWFYQQGYVYDCFFAYNDQTLLPVYFDVEGRQYDKLPADLELAWYEGYLNTLRDYNWSAYTALEDEKTGLEALATADGQALTPYQFDRIITPIYGEHVIAREKGKTAYAVYDTAGKRLHNIPELPKNCYIEPIGGSYFLICDTKSNSPDTADYLWSALTADGRIYDAAANQYTAEAVDRSTHICRHLTGNLCTFNGGLYRTTDLSEIAPAGTYSHIDEFVNGVALVIRGEEYDYCGLIDTSGREILPCEYDLDWEAYDWDYIAVSPDDSSFIFMKDDGYYLVQVKEDTTPVTAQKTVQPVLIDGKAAALDAYTIDNYTYCRLRDLASALKDTDSKFAVGYDSASNTVSLETGKADAGAPQPAGASSAKAVPSAQRVTLDGQPVELTAYAIGGYNYFKLRDLGGALGFGVDWDGTNIQITTAK